MKRKKILCMLLCLAVLAAAAGCGNGSETSGRTANSQAGVEDVLQAGMAQADGNADKSTPENETQSGAGGNAPEAEGGTGEDAAYRAPEGIDVDLTALSSTMVYSEVYNMMCAPEEYMGKTVKMNGLFATYHDESTDNYYFACIIQDATACCAQGIEFVLTDDYSYPDDYPEEGNSITVIGVFDTYMEGSYQYCTLRDARLVS